MAIAYDSSAKNSPAVNNSTTFSHTCTGSNLILFVSAEGGNHDGDTVTGATYAGATMRLITKEQSRTNTNYVYLYYLLNPATGANNVVVTRSGGASTFPASSASYTGVKQSLQPDAYNTGTKNFSNDSTANGSITTVADNCWLVMANQFEDMTGISSSNGTVRQSGTRNAICDSNGSKGTAGSGKLLTVTAGNDNLSWVLASFQPVNGSDTFYPDPNTEITSVDGRVWHDNFPTTYTWSQVHDNAGTGGSDSETAGSAPGLNRSGADNTSYNRSQRGIFIFDTTPIGDSDTISSATLSLYCQSVDNGYGSFSTNLTSTTTSASTSLTSTDYNIANYGSTNLSDTSKSLASGWTTSAYNDYTLNSSGLSNISKTAVSKFAHRITNDITNTTPSATGSGAAATTLSFSETSGTSQDPKLVVTYQTTSIKTINGLAYASVKTTNGLALASMKTKNSLT